MNKSIVADVNQNNDITANAFTERGGNITVAVENVISIEARATTSNNSTNDINESFRLGSSGCEIF